MKTFVELTTVCGTSSRLVGWLAVACHAIRARGYHVNSWTRGGVAVWIVSDLALVELDDFARKLDAAMHD